jgi:hypothetical protein
VRRRGTVRFPAVRNPCLDEVVHWEEFVRQEEMMRPALDRFINEFAISNLIERTLADPLTAKSVADASYRHINGFDKVILARGVKESYVIRLNIWWPDAVRTVGDVHDHCWSFSSFIVCGELTIHHYEQSPDGMPFTAFTAQPLKEQSGDKLRSLGEVHIQERFTGCLKEGSSYTLSYRQLHTATAEAGVLAATLVFQTRKFKDHPTVLRRAFETQIVVPHRRMSVRELYERLDRLGSALA